MAFNPFKEKPQQLFETVRDWDALYRDAYRKEDTSPFTKMRIILANGGEFEAVNYLHSFIRHCNNNDLRRELAMISRLEQQQQKTLEFLKPINETILETTIAYEQLAVELTAGLAKTEKDENVKKVLDFALLEDFDHLYRYANLLDMDSGISAEKLVGGYTEIMPARPTIAHHRHPVDTIKRHIDNKTADIVTKLNVSTITAAEQQTRNYYMNVGSFYFNDIGRKLYLEIAMVEEDHVTEYGSLMDVNSTWLECLLMHEYTECFGYYSCWQSEEDPKIKKIFELHFQDELAHLHKAKELLEKYEHKDYTAVVGNGDFPAPLVLGSNIDYVRDVLARSVTLTTQVEDYCSIKDLPAKNTFYMYQSQVNDKLDDVISHKVIENYIRKNGKDYRYEVAQNPIKDLRSRKDDNTTVGVKES